MKNKENKKKETLDLPVCVASSSCAEHARLWDECDEPCYDGRAGVIHEAKGKEERKVK